MRRTFASVVPRPCPTGPRTPAHLAARPGRVQHKALLAARLIVINFRRYTVFSSYTSTQAYQSIAIAMALSMAASSMMGAMVAAPQRTAAPRRAAAPVSASLRTDVARFAKAAGVGAASLALALSAQAAEVKLGLDNGDLVRASALLE